MCNMYSHFEGSMLHPFPPQYRMQYWKTTIFSNLISNMANFLKRLFWSLAPPTKGAE